MPRGSDEYGETYGVFEYPSGRKRFITKVIQEAKWNPIFWISVAFTIFSACALVIHSYWSFVFGSLFSVMSLVVGGVCIYLCFLSRFKKPWHQLWKREVARIIFFCLFCISIQGLFISLNAVLLKNHFAGSDPGWTSFPTQCIPAKDGVTLNCVRTGYNISSPYTSPGLDPIYNKNYTQNPEFVLKQMANIAESHMNCDHVHTDSDWIHFRCLSELFGRPSDLAIRVFPNPAPGNGNATFVWVHSQSRAGGWDQNANDGLVRLLFMYKYLCDTMQGGVNCKKTFV
eukprot:Phypoly_transcript_13945.p1 GENE.Phypoly_transcript_13945~~Phypoly_transcript_13945.p1  ORF type:complete len:285 (+),score=19.81 Phypoly_transcript_13945:172-1026(+)